MQRKLAPVLLALAMMFTITTLTWAAHSKTVRVKVNKRGFSPSSLVAEEGSPLTLIFTRTSKHGCGSKVVFPSLGITRDLPLGRPITVKFTPETSGEIAFTCGMGMYNGSIVVQ